MIFCKRKYVFPITRADQVSFVAKNDHLSCAVARRYLKCRRDKLFRLEASRKIRQLAALFVEIKKNKVKSWLSALDPLNFDIIVECTKIISIYVAEAETYGAPSLVTHMGTELKDCIEVAYNMSLNMYNKESEATKRLKYLKKIIASE